LDFQAIWAIRMKDVLRIATGCAGGKLIQIFSAKKIWREATKNIFPA